MVSNFMMQKKVNKIISLITVICFLTTETLLAFPGASIEFARTYETPSFLQVDIPEELATVDEIFEAPARPDPRLILHIQNAHANYEAQTQIKKLLQYLNEKYDFKTIFVEGAAETLNPDYLKFFPDKERNLKLADLLAKQGELTGAELFLIDSESDVEGIGIENTELYRNNYDALKKVYGAETDINRYLNGYESRLEKLSSKIFSREIRKVISEWKKFEKGHRDFLPYAKRLSKNANDVLGINLESLFAQIDWPQMSRLLAIQAMEKNLDVPKALSEKKKLLTFLKKNAISEEVIQGLERFKDGQIGFNRISAGAEPLENLPRYLLERLAEEAGPKGFSFHKYPAFSLYAGFLTLKNELDSRALFSEIELLFSQILEKLVKTPNQKELLSIYKDE